MRPKKSRPEHRVSLSWLLRVRWAALLGIALLIALVQPAMHVVLPLGVLALLGLVVALTNAAAHAWQRADVNREPTRAPIAVLLGTDVVVLTLGLYMTGGAANPFVGAYLVLVVLAAVLLGRRLALVMVLVAVASVGALTALHEPLHVDHTHADHDAEQHHHAGVAPARDGGTGHLSSHLRGSWAAFAVLALLVAYLVSWALRQREDQLAVLSAERDRAAKLAELGTLAATAAHELGSPLTTIAVISKELERALAKDASELAEDARAIRAQVERCRQVLDELGRSAREARGETALPVAVDQILADARALTSTPERIEIDIHEGAREARVLAPPRAMTQVLRSLLANAHEAASDGSPIRVSATAGAGRCQIEIRDDGVGMSAAELAHAGHTPFSSKPGHGMGVGLFLGRALLERIGGTLELHSEAGRGTRVVLSLPLAEA